jgi:adenylate cyclase
MGARFGMKRPGLTLGQAFFINLVGLALLLGLLLFLLFRDSRKAIVDSSASLRRAKSALFAHQVEEYLGSAETSVDNIERQLRYVLARDLEPGSIEASLFSEMLNNADLTEATFTHAVRQAYDENLEVLLAPGGRWQVSVIRLSPGERLLTRFVHKDGRSFVAEVRNRAPDAGLLDAPLTKPRAFTAPDPTEHPTFRTTASARLLGEHVLSDLSYTEIDAELPEAQRRVVLTAMKAVEDRAGHFLGVVRVGILESQIDHMAIDPVTRNPGDPHRIFICDSQGRLITRLSDRDTVEDLGGDLRVRPSHPAPEIVRALGHPALKGVSSAHLDASGDFEIEGRRFLVSFRGLPSTQGWRVGIVVAEDELEGIADLSKARKRLLLWCALLMALILLGGVATLRGVRRGLGKIVESTARMRDFDFAPASVRSPFRDVSSVMEGLELAKTAMRAMGKYVPIDLVRLLYKTGREPVLGGELADVSLMFTDIKDFTALSEKLSPNDLAAVLGRYLEVMTDAIQGVSGTIDKYIGDGIMAVWNVPMPCPGHPAKACEAALACVDAEQRLYASPAWGGRAPFVTRFGIHTDRVLVGHFGAPDRLSFTALGDGVNLASRLESLNKQYGTRIMVSEAVVGLAWHAFGFRLRPRRGQGQKQRHQGL